MQNIDHWTHFLDPLAGYADPAHKQIHLIKHQLANSGSLIENNCGNLEDSFSSVPTANIESLEHRWARYRYLSLLRLTPIAQIKQGLHLPRRRRAKH